MVDIETVSRDIDGTGFRAGRSAGRPTRAMGGAAIRLLPLSITAIAAALAIVLSAAMWHVYMEAPWTSDATVRAYVVTLAPEVAGRIVELHAVDNQFVHKGDLLMVVDPTNFRIALRLAEATVDQSKATAENARSQAERRRKLSDLAETIEDRQTFEAQSLAADAQYQQAVARRDQAKVDLGRTEIRSPVNGWVTNLLAQKGDYVRVGQNVISLVNADSFWVDAYFEETQLAGMREGDPVRIKLMGYKQIVRGEVGSVARGITVANAQPDGQGLAAVNPIFTWVRLAQRVPVRIRIDQVPADVRLVAGMTATVQVDPRRPTR
ncbi:multidrug resistance efflux pump [Bradyrhizobium japonicum]|nr:HlyD family secretion protein [Bradyrhizobium japonicum]MCS3497764.1 multidrug resistance efflux pump [Bradyrhizobium japonicum]MCS3960075.1 multidrug resistance efflux pump [Bradyrhizobium japonicum]MCS4001828.1 multidrug resistance efflux pump [Bradyrhizobium japonicum]MCW2221048.1 multidrug resistance efflux pump [Bradyrhizobium japonicum]MCW2345660.1 multidrug resistance efflux pump [Bradyrhizobium japonicum]